jgi:hypothetical protein
MISNKLIPATISMFSDGPWLIVKCMQMTSSICSTNKHIPATILMFSVGPWLIVKCMMVTLSLNSKFAIHLHA